MKTLAASFGISKDGAHAGVVTFSSDVEHSIKLNDHFNLNDFNKAVQGISHMKNYTRIDKALRLTQKEMFTAANGGRPDAKTIVIVLTDGSQTRQGLKDLEDPALVARELRDIGYTVLAIGMGSGADTNELIAITGNEDHVYSATTFEELITEEFLNRVNKGGCEEGIYFIRR